MLTVSCKRTIFQSTGLQSRRPYHCVGTAAIVSRTGPGSSQSPEFLSSDSFHVSEDDSPCQTLVTCVRQARETCSEDAKGGRDSLLKETTRLTRLFRNSFSLHLILSMHKTSSVTAFQQHLDSTKSSPPEPKATSTSNPINKNISHPSDVTRDVSTSDPPSAATKIDRWTNKQRRVHAGRVPFPHY